MLKKNANLRRLTYVNVEICSIRTWFDVDLIPPCRLTSTCLSDDGLARICAALKGNKRIEHLEYVVE